MKAYIISTGNEITEGIIIDLNSKYLSSELKKIHIETIKIVNVRDNKIDIQNAFEEGLKLSDIIILTGGLGPTEDDITRESISEYLKKPLIKNPSIEKKIKDYYRYRTGKELAILSKQSEIIEGAEILNNPVGSAPGQIIHENNKIVILLPGPPKEVKEIFEKEILFILNKSNNINKNSEMILYFYGITEAELMNDIYTKIPNSLEYSTKIEMYIGPSIRLRGDYEILQSVSKEIITLYKNNFLGYNNIVDEFCFRLIKDKLTISVAESCTGGMLGEKITTYSGISKVFMGGYIVYSNLMKEKMLHVSHETLDKFGAVSDECVIELVKGLNEETGTDICISISGIAGPDGGNDTKPVGTVFFGFKIKNEYYSIKKIYNGDREEIRERAVYFAMFEVISKLRTLEEG